MSKQGPDIFLFEAARVIIKKWKAIFLFVLGSLTVFAICGTFIGDRAESRFVIKLAVFSGTLEEFDRPLEPPVSVMERLKVASNITPELIRSCQLKAGEYLNPKVIKILVRGNFFDVSVWGDSAERSKKCAEAFIEYLQKEQEPLIKLQTGRIEQKNEELVSQISAVSKGNGKSPFPDLETQLLMVDLALSRATLKSLSTPELSKPIFTTDVPARPTQILLIKLGIVIGLGLGILYSLGAQNMRGKKTTEPS